MDIYQMGQAFAPTPQNDQDRAGQAAAGQNVQEAVKILSLHLPKVWGAAPANLGLLQPNPAAPGAPISAIVESILRRYGGQPGVQPGGPVSAPTGSAWQQPGFQYAPPQPATYAPPPAPEQPSFRGVPEMPQYGGGVRPRQV